MRHVGKYAAAKTGQYLACVASVSVRFGSKESQRENGASKRRGRGRKEDTDLQIALKIHGAAICKMQNLHLGL